MFATEFKVCPNPVFVIGSPRSGTTILAWALNNHSQLFNLNETTVLLELFGKDRAVEAYQKAYDRPAPTMLRKFGVERAEFLQAIGLGINALFSSKSQGKRWIDKTPQYTLILDLLAEMFPGALFIHILRDGRRVVHSMVHFHNAPSREKQRQKMGPIKAQDFTSACQQWNHYVSTAMNFCAAHSPRCLTILNEDLVARTEEGFGQIYRFLELPNENEPVEYFRNNQINSSFWPGGHVDGPLTERFVDPWDNWPAELKQTFIEETGSTLVRWGLAGADQIPVLGGQGCPQTKP